MKKRIFDNVNEVSVRRSGYEFLAEMTPPFLWYFQPQTSKSFLMLLMNLTQRNEKRSLGEKWKWLPTKKLLATFKTINLDSSLLVVNQTFHLRHERSKKPSRIAAFPSFVVRKSLYFLHHEITSCNRGKTLEKMLRRGKKVVREILLKSNL